MWTCKKRQKPTCFWDRRQGWSSCSASQKEEQMHFVPDTASWGPRPWPDCGIHGYPLFGHTCSSSFFGVIIFWGHLSSSSIVSVSAGLPACFVDVLVINLVILAAVVSSSNCFFYGFLYFEFPYLHPRIFCFWHVFANIPPSPTRPPSTRPHSHSIVCLD